VDQKNINGEGVRMGIVLMGMGCGWDRDADKIF